MKFAIKNCVKGIYRHLPSSTWKGEVVKFLKKVFLRKRGMEFRGFEPRLCGAPTEEMRQRIASIRQRQYREFLAYFPYPIYGTVPFRARGSLPVSMSKTRVLWCLEKIEACCSGNIFAMGTKFSKDDPFRKCLNV